MSRDKSKKGRSEDPPLILLLFLCNSLKNNGLDAINRGLTRDELHPCLRKTRRTVRPIIRFPQVAQRNRKSLADIQRIPRIFRYTTLASTHCNVVKIFYTQYCDHDKIFLYGYVKKHHVS